MLIVLSLLQILSCGAYVFFYEKITKKQILIFKMVTSLFFFLVALYALIRSNQYNTYDLFTFIGICCGFLGDLFLGFRNIFRKQKDLFFILGITAFTAGHMGYINAMFTLFHSKIWLLILLTVLLFSSSLILLHFTKVSFGKTRVFCYIYLLFSSIFLSLAVLNIIRIDELYVYFLMIGVVAFVSSDVLLSYLYFGKLGHRVKKLFKKINIVTYYVGQFIIALSIFLL